MYMYLRSELAQLLTLYTSTCKLIRQVALPAVGLAAKLKLFWNNNYDLITLTIDLSTSKWVTGHPCHGLPSCQFTACYALPFST